MDNARREYLRRLEQIGYVPRFMPDGTACSVTEQGAAPDRFFVISIPKAGTYLAAEVLAALGVRSSKLHVDYGWVGDYREYRKDTKIWKYHFRMPVADALALIQPGQFAVGHLPFSERSELDGFSKVFIFRELRHAFVSWSRFVIAEKMDPKAAEAAQAIPDGPERVLWVLTRESSEWLVPLCREIVPWRLAPDGLSIRFEDLVGDNGAQAQDRIIDALVQHRRLPLNDDTRRAVRACVGADTFTWSGARSGLASHWDERLEKWFRSVDGPALNRALGYPEPDG